MEGVQVRGYEAVRFYELSAHVYVRVVGGGGERERVKMAAEVAAAVGVN